MVTRIIAQKAAEKAARQVSAAVSGTLGLTGERMSKVDTAWLRMDNDVNLMMIVGVWLLTPALSLAAVRERVQGRLLKYDQAVNPERTCCVTFAGVFHSSWCSL